VPDRDALPTVAAFAAIYLVWGSTFLAIRYAVETIPPYSMMSLRCLGGGAILIGLWRLREPPAPWPSVRELSGCALLGLLFFVTATASWRARSSSCRRGWRPCARPRSRSSSRS